MPDPGSRNLVLEPIPEIPKQLHGRHIQGIVSGGLPATPSTAPCWWKKRTVMAYAWSAGRALSIVLADGSGRRAALRSAATAARGGRGKKKTGKSNAFRRERERISHRDPTARLMLRHYFNSNPATRWRASDLTLAMENQNEKKRHGVVRNKSASATTVFLPGQGSLVPASAKSVSDPRAGAKRRREFSEVVLACIDDSSAVNRAKVVHAAEVVASRGPALRAGQ